MKLNIRKFIRSAKRPLAVLFLIAVVSQTSSKLRADDAGAFIKDLLAYNGGVTITMTSINVNGSVGYSQFYMGKVIRPGPSIPAHIQGTASEFFNDRFKEKNPSDQPFDIAQTDKVQLDVSYNQIVLTLLSWKNGRIVFSPSLVDNVLYGWSPNGRTYFVLCCTKVAPIQ